MTSKRRALAVAMVAAIAGASLAAADELPAFKQGLWSYSSTVAVQGTGKPRVRTVQRCTSPSEDIKKKWDLLAAQSCKFSPVTHTGNRYTYTSTCQRNGVALWMLSVISVDSDSSYRVDMESHTGNQTQKEVLVARRVGDCPK